MRHDGDRYVELPDLVRRWESHYIIEYIARHGLFELATLVPGGLTLLPSPSFSPCPLCAQDRRGSSSRLTESLVVGLKLVPKTRCQQ